MDQMVSVCARPTFPGQPDTVRLQSHRRQPVVLRRLPIMVYLATDCRQVKSAGTIYRSVNMMRTAKSRAYATADCMSVIRDFGPVFPVWAVSFRLVNHPCWSRSASVVFDRVLAILEALGNHFIDGAKTRGKNAQGARLANRTASDLMTQTLKQTARFKHTERTGKKRSGRTL